PHAETGPALSRRASPRAAVVDKEGLWQAIAAKRQLQASLHGAALLVGTRVQTQVIARMIVQHRQRMATASIAKLYPALEIHLPKQVRRGLLKALVRPSSACWTNNTIMAAQDLVHGGKGRSSDPLTFKTACDLARSPRRVGVAQRQNTFLDHLIR